MTEMTAVAELIEGQRAAVVPPNPTSVAHIGATSVEPSEHTMTSAVEEAVHLQVAGAVGAFSGGDQASAMSAIAMLREMQPRTAAEAVIITQAIAAHHASMKAYERASIPGIPFAIQSQQLTLAMKLGRAAGDALAAIEKRRGGSPQSVRVDRVIVEDGGQAIVGQVTRSGGLQ